MIDSSQPTPPNAPLHITHIETGMHLYGGAQQVVYLLNGLANRGINNTLIAPEGSAISQAVAKTGNAKVITTSRSGDLSLSFYRQTKAILKRHPCDLVHIHSRRGADTLGGLAAKAAGIPAVLSRRVDNLEHPLAIRYKYPLYRQVIGISQAICNVLLKQGIKQDQLNCVHSTVDSGVFNTDAASRQTARASLAAQFNIPDSNLLLAVVAQLIPRKGHSHLLSVLPNIIAQQPNISLLIFGQGPEREAIAAKIEQLGLNQQVQLAGFCPQLDKDLPGIDIIVHPAEKEGLGVALLKASAAGVAIIAGRAGGIPEIVQDGKNGLLFDPTNHAQLQSCLEQLIASPALRQQMGSAGIAIAQNQFSIDTMVDGNLAVYRRALAIH